MLRSARLPLLLDRHPLRLRQLCLRWLLPLRHTMRTQNFRRLFIVAVVGGTASCVSGTVYQRAMALQEDPPPADAVKQGLRDENWKLRYLAAQACGAGKDPACLETLRSIAVADRAEAVRNSALTAMTTRCSSGGADSLAALAGPNAPSDSRTFACIVAAVSLCPSSDAVLLLSSAAPDSAEVGELLRTRRLGARPVGGDAALSWLKSVALLPEPRSATERALRELERGRQDENRRAEDAERARAETQRLAEENAAEEKQKRRAREHEEGLAQVGIAHRALAMGDVRQAVARYRRAKDEFGVSDPEFEPTLSAAATKLGRTAVTTAWAAVKNGALDKASEGASEAAAFGVVDEKLDAAVEQLRTRRAEEEERRREREDARRNAAEEHARWLTDHRCSAAKATCARARQGCEKVFSALVGDSATPGFGRSIGGRIQAINSGMRAMGLSNTKKEVGARDVPALVAALRNSREDFLGYCGNQMGKIVEPCDPYAYGTRPYALCIEERQPEMDCFVDRGPWRHLSNLKPGALTDDQLVVVSFMIGVASGRPYCAQSE